MLASRKDRPFNDPDWIFEVKWDGYRMMAQVEKGKVSLRSRNDKDYTKRFELICKDLTKWKHDAILDGEMVVVREDGVSHFNSLENWYSAADGQLRYYVFDILWLDGKSLLEVPLLERKEILHQKFPKSKAICFNDHFPGNMGIDLYEQANKFKLEGIIAKHATSEYFPGARTKQWLKIKVDQWVEGIIVGYTKEREQDKHFRRLLIAVKVGKELQYIGAVGTGFTQQSMEHILRMVTEARKCPLAYRPDPNKATRFRKASTDIIYWVQPKVKCLIKYQEITAEGVMRHPSFKGIV